MPGNTEEIKFHMKFLVDKEKGKVIFAEAGYDFVDILFSFLTLPMATILRLLQEENIPDAKAISFGSLSSLYKGLEKLDPKHFWTNEYCKNMLLKPRNSSESECRKLKVNFDKRRYFKCDKWDCGQPKYSHLYSVTPTSTFSPFSTDKCVCGNLMNIEVCLERDKVADKRGVFVSETSTFIISNDLCVKPNSAGYVVEVLSGFGIRDMSLLEECSFTFGSKEFQNVLKCMLFSRTPLDDLFFGKKAVVISHQVDMERKTSNKGKKLTLKLIVLKSSRKLLFCEAGADFIDFIFSFLVIPLGSVVNLLGGNTCLGCIDNLHKSVSKLKAGKDVKSCDLKKKLTNPQLAYPYLSLHQIFSLKEEKFESRFSYFDNIKRMYVSSSSPCSAKDNKDNSGNLNMKNARVGGEFVKGPDTFMVTDDLVVTHFSSMSALKILDNQNIKFCDVEEQVVTIGKDEALSILMASLHTESALSNSLSAFFKKNEANTL